MTRRRATSATCAALVASALALAGCSTLMPGAGEQDRSASAGERITVVFIGVDLRAVQDITGFEIADTGDPEVQVEALEAWVNDHGGIGGRELEAVFRSYDGATDSPAAEEQLCNQVTQDDRAFAVVLDGQFQQNARPCYAKAETLMLDATLVSIDSRLRQELAPYLWSPSFPDYDRVVRALVSTLDDKGFFAERERVGVVIADTPVNRRVMADVAAPLLQRAGVEPDVAWVDTTDQGTLFQGNDEAAVSFRSLGIDRVMFLGGARIGAVFTTVAAAKSFKARYAVSSIDNPLFFERNPDIIPVEALEGMIGIGTVPALDLGDAQYPFPSGRAEKTCMRIYGEAGITFPSREAARVALPYCDAVRLLDAAGDAVEGRLTVSSWADAAAEVDLASATGLSGGSGFGYRVIRHDPGCSCFVYEGPRVELPER